MAPHQTSRRRQRHNAGTNDRRTSLEALNDDVIEHHSTDNLESQKSIDCIYKAVQQLQLLCEQQNKLDVRLSRLQQPNSTNDEYHVHHVAMNSTYTIRRQGLCNVIDLYIEYIMRTLQKLKLIQPEELQWDIEEMLDLLSNS